MPRMINYDKTGMPRSGLNNTVLVLRHISGIAKVALTKKGESALRDALVDIKDKVDNGVVPAVRKAQRKIRKLTKHNKFLQNEIDNFVE